jgi:DNA-binding response OmpR family regulator
MSKILVIEDDPAIRKAVAEGLRQDNFEVETGGDAEQGMEILGRFEPNLILLDLILPGKNGFEFLKEIKASAKLSKIPVIILSNLGDQEEVQQALKLGAEDFLIKADYNLSEVVEIIKKHLSKS